MKRIRKPKTTKIQKKIKKALIDADLTMTQIAHHYGVTGAAVYQHLLRHDEKYFYEAIKAIQEEGVYAETGTEG